MRLYGFEVEVGDRAVACELENRLGTLLAAQSKRETPASLAARLQKVWGWIRRTPRAVRPSGATAASS